MSLNFSEINQMDQTEFVQNFGAIFEHTPAIAKQAWYKLPFKNILELYGEMIMLVDNLAESEKLTLICAHPDLGSKLKMAESSIQEQAGVGLDRLDASEFEQFQGLNLAYRDKYGFPFIIAVKDHSKNSILRSFGERLENPFESELEIALIEIKRIAWHRLNALIEENQE